MDSSSVASFLHQTDRKVHKKNSYKIFIWLFLVSVSECYMQTFGINNKVRNKSPAAHPTAMISNIVYLAEHHR